MRPAFNLYRFYLNRLALLVSKRVTRRAGHSFRLKKVFLTVLFLFSLNSCFFGGGKNQIDNEEAPKIKKSSEFMDCASLTKNPSYNSGLIEEKCLSLDKKIKGFYNQLLEESYAYLNNRIEKTRSGESVEPLNFEPFVDKIELNIGSLSRDSLLSNQLNSEILKPFILSAVLAAESRYYEKMEPALKDYLSIMLKVVKDDSESLNQSLDQKYEQLKDKVDLNSLDQESALALEERYDEQIRKKQMEILRKSHYNSQLALLKEDMPLQNESEAYKFQSQGNDPLLTESKEFSKRIHSYWPYNEQGRKAKLFSLAGVELLDESFSKGLKSEAELIYQIVLSQENIIKGELLKGLEKATYEYCAGKGLWTGLDIEEDKRISHLHEALSLKIQSREQDNKELEGAEQNNREQDKEDLFGFLIELFKEQDSKGLVDEREGVAMKTKEPALNEKDELAGFVNESWFKAVRSILDKICERKRELSLEPENSEKSQ